MLLKDLVVAVAIDEAHVLQCRCRVVDQAAIVAALVGRSDDRHVSGTRRVPLELQTRCSALATASAVLVACRTRIKEGAQGGGRWRRERSSGGGFAAARALRFAHGVVRVKRQAWGAERRRLMDGRLSMVDRCEGVYARGK